MGHEELTEDEILAKEYEADIDYIEDEAKYCSLELKDTLPHNWAKKVYSHLAIKGADMYGEGVPTDLLYEAFYDCALTKSRWCPTCGAEWAKEYTTEDWVWTPRQKSKRRLEWYYEITDRLLREHTELWDIYWPRVQDYWQQLKALENQLVLPGFHYGANPPKPDMWYEEYDCEVMLCDRDGKIICPHCLRGYLKED